MSVWTTQNVEEHVREVLATVAEGVPGHHFGPPFVTAYQLAIELDRQHPAIREALAHELGGEGTGDRHSFAQYLARELSRRINLDPNHPVEGRMLSNADVVAIDYRGPSGEPIRSSLAGSGYDLSIFRLRQ